MSAPIPPIAALTGADPLFAPQALAGPTAPASSSFSQMLMKGVEQVDQKLAAADSLAAKFAVDDSVPLHQVTYALEQARLSLELMLQVRARLVEAYQEVSRMHL
jgi:flagellar hook-basal body complex protein FliE